MRNRILAGLGVAALASVGVATPATALSSTTADIWVVHAVSGVEVDVYINGGLVTALTGFDPGAVQPLADVAPGNYVVDIVPAAVAPPQTITEGSGLFGTGAAGVDVEAGKSYTLVAHPSFTQSGEPLLLTPYVNDLSAVPAGQASVTVRHTANAPEVRAVVVDDNGQNPVNLFGGTATLTNTQSARTSVPAGTYDVQVRVAAGDAVAIDVPNLPLAANTHYFIHAFGPNATAPTFRVIAFPIAGAVAGVPAGSAGLVAEDSSSTGLLIGGAAALLALLAAAGVVVARRQGTSVER